MLETSIGTDNDDDLTEVACGVVERDLADSSPNGAGGLFERGSDSERAGVGKVGGGTVSASHFCGCMLRRRACALFLSLFARGMLFFSSFGGLVVLVS